MQCWLLVGVDSEPSSIPIYVQQFPSYSNRKCKQEAQLSLTNRTVLFCKVVEVLQFAWRFVRLEWCGYPMHHAIKTPGSMYPSIYNSFPVIRTTMQKIVIFTYPGQAFIFFLFALGTPLRQSRKTLHEWKDNSMLVKPLIACTHLSSTVSQLFEPQVQKNCRFHVPQPTFVFLLETLLRLSRNMLHGWKDNSMLAKPLAACTYLYSILSELYDAYVNV